MTTRVFIAGAAGLVGQNLIAILAGSDVEIIGVDKSKANLKILGELHPEIRLIEADLAEPGPWQSEVASCDVVVMLQAQIGGLNWEDFVRNNMTSTERVLQAMAANPDAYLVHVSSSVVNSAADDFYTRSKGAQEKVVAASAVRHVILRPTLMFGWFDRKHVGWLKRFMDRTPVFPIPGNGRYLRQPLYAGDFARIIAACIAQRPTGAYNISGLEKIDYVDMIRLVKAVAKSKTTILHIPYGLFWLLLATYALVDKNPPFTTSQLAALVTPDVFEVIDWPGIFGVQATPMRKAFEETFLDPVYANVTLQF
jgi:nucleoside-diphosphate-sugar epimerase